LNKALIYTKLNDFQLADVFADKAMEIAHKINDRLSVADIYKIKGVIKRCTKNYEMSENYLQTSLRINTDLQNLLNLAETNYELGLLCVDIKKLKDAKKYFNLAVKQFKQLKMNDMANKVKKEILESK